MDIAMKHIDKDDSFITGEDRGLEIDCVMYLLDTVLDICPQLQAS